MSGQAKQQVPRFGKRKAAPAGPVITIKGRGARKLQRDLVAIAASGQAVQPGTSPPAGLLARTGAYRFRRHLVPVALLGAIALAGPGCHAMPSPRGTILGLILGLAGAGAIWRLTRHGGDWARRAGLASAALAGAWVPVLALAGLARPWPALAFITWAPLMWAWARRYRWRPGEEPQRDTSDIALWSTTLGAKGRLAGSALGFVQPIANGTKYTLSLKRGAQDSSDVFGMSKKIASLFGKPVTEVYPERFPDGREHQVTLTVLRANSLAKVRMWGGEGIDPATGLAVVGDFPDGTPAHFRFWSPRNGAEQSIVVGVKGGGKSYLLHLLLSAAVRSEVPVVPIVLDPQQGQSLPDWRGQVTYARGVAQCMLYLRAFEAGMMARSDYLADFAWTDEDGYERPGMDFYDPRLSGLPLIFMVFDEAHLVLADPRYGEEAKRIVGNLVKLNRKAGGHLMLVSHTLLLTQLGDMTLRAMVIGGNAVALRTGESLSGGMIGLEADPKLLPRTFADGSETHGLGYIVGPDSRPDSPMRVRLVRNPRKVAVEAHVAEMDAVFGTAFRRVLDQAAPKPSRPAAATPIAAVPPAEDESAGRSAADAALTVLTGAGCELTKGEIIVRCSKLVTETWQPPRKAAFQARTLTDALNKLMALDQVDRTAHGSYVTRKPSLHAVPENATASNGATAP